MSPQQALTTLYDSLALLCRLEPGFHTQEDCADLGKARWAQLNPDLSASFDEGDEEEPDGLS